MLAKKINPCVVEGCRIRALRNGSVGGSWSSSFGLATIGGGRTQGGVHHQHGRIAADPSDVPVSRVLP
jgi:hypothetical protein